MKELIGPLTEKSIDTLIEENFKRTIYYANNGLDKNIGKLNTDALYTINFPEAIGYLEHKPTRCELPLN